MTDEWAQEGAGPGAGGSAGPGGSRLRVRTVEILPGEVVLIDQLALPHEERYVHCRTVMSVMRAATSCQVMQRT